MDLNSIEHLGFPWPYITRPFASAVHKFGYDMIWYDMIYWYHRTWGYPPHSATRAGLCLPMAPGQKIRRLRVRSSQWSCPASWSRWVVGSVAWLPEGCQTWLAGKSPKVLWGVFMAKCGRIIDKCGIFDTFDYQRIRWMCNTQYACKCIYAFG